MADETSGLRVSERDTAPFWAVIAILSVVVVGGCAHKVAPPKKRQPPSQTKVAIEVDQQTVLSAGFEEKLRGKLSDVILSTNHGIPVQERSQADLVIQFNVTRANFTQATRWKWRIFDAKSGAVLQSNSEDAPLGAAPSTLANEAVTGLAELEVEPRRGEESKAEKRRAAAGTEFNPPSSSTDGRNAWGVVVGIESYRDDLPDVDGARADAEAFADFATTTLNVPEANLKVLVGERATRADLRAALFEWLPRNAVASGGTVYVYFSGHGTPSVETGDAYLLPYDARPQYLESSGLRLEEVRKSLSSLTDQDVYLFLDACFSGSGERSVLAEGTRPVVPVKHIESTSSVATIAAAEADQTTGVHNGTGHGLFTYHLLNGLTGAADEDDDRNVTIDEIESHLEEKIRVEARRDNRDQSPSVILPKDWDPSSPLVHGLDSEK